MSGSDSRLHYEVHGRPDAPVVLLSSGLGGAAGYWASQIPVLVTRFRVIAYDQLGTGRSPGRLPDGYSVADMAVEVAAMLEAIGVSRCRFVGHALGGLIGLRLAVDRPELLDRLVLVNAWAKTHPHTLRCFEARVSLLRHVGIDAFVKAQALFLYPADWLASRQDWLVEQDSAGVAHFQGAETVLRRIAAISAFDMTADLAMVGVPVAVIAARDDILAPSACSAALAALLPEATLTVMQHGGHACNVTDPDGFNALMMCGLGTSDTA